MEKVTLRSALRAEELPQQGQAPSGVRDLRPRCLASGCLVQDRTWNLQQESVHALPLHTDAPSGVSLEVPGRLTLPALRHREREASRVQLVQRPRHHPRPRQQG